MPDFDAINTALVARFAAAAVTPPAGYDNIKAATGDLPTGMLNTPCVLVFPESGEFPIHTGGTRDSDHQFIVRFYYNQSGDLERDMVALRKWLQILVDQLSASLTLGIAPKVTYAHIIAWTIGILEYTPNTYTGIELTVKVNVNEPWQPGG